MREYFQIFSDEGVLLNSFVEIHCSTAEEGLDQNRMAVNVMGGGAGAGAVEVTNE